MRRFWFRAAVTTTGKSGADNPDRANWRTAACVSASERNLPAVARLTVARGLLTHWAVRDGATVLPVLCAWSGSLPGNAPNIERPPPTVAMVDPLLLTDCRTSQLDAPIKSGSAIATAVLTAQGWLYLVAVLDVFTRRVIGWAMSQILDATLAIAALRMPLGRRRPAQTLILHSDRGAQFASAAYRQVLAQHGLVASMSRKANCYDNAFIESFFSSLKYELVYHQRFATRAQARTAIFDYIETFYNRTRLHSSLDYLSPINFESKLN